MTLTIEEGRHYRTRDGRKVGPILALNTTGWGGWCSDGLVWQTNGVHGDGDDEPSRRTAPNRPKHDLVALWTEVPAGPVRTRTVTEIVDGVYGRLLIKAPTQEQDRAALIIGLTTMQGSCPDGTYGWTLGELTAAIATLTAVRDALEAQP